MKAFYIKLIVFAGLLFLIDKPIGYFISSNMIAKRYDNKIELLFDGSVRDEVVIIGSSRALYGINPEVMTNGMGENCYNFGFAGSNIRFHETIFNLVTSNYIPEKLILTLDEDSTFVEGKKTIYRKDKLHPYLKYDEVLSEYCKNSNKDYLSSKLCWTYRENQNFFEAVDYLRKGKDLPSITSNIDQHGAIMFPKDSVRINESVAFQKKFSTYNKELEQEHMLECFEHIIERSKELGIKVYVVRLPRFSKRLNGFNERIAEFSNRKDFKFIDLSSTIEEREKFYDSGHLNELGSIQISKILAQQLN